MNINQNQPSPDSCIFCAIIAGQAPSVVVHEDEHTLAIMDINPATRGHVLVLPKRHARDIFEIPEEDAQHVMHTVLLVARAVDKALQPDGVNLIQANRKAAFQSVFHFHIHVIPRWWDDGLVPPWRHRREETAVLQELAGRIRGELETACSPA